MGTILVKVHHTVKGDKNGFQIIVKPVMPAPSVPSPRCMVINEFASKKPDE
jgi:hypothetical protein